MCSTSPLQLVEQPRCTEEDAATLHRPPPAAHQRSGGMIGSVVEMREVVVAAALRLSGRDKEGGDHEVEGSSPLVTPVATRRKCSADI
jgi:hypothetical protein